MLIKPVLVMIHISYSLLFLVSGCQPRLSQYRVQVQPEQGVVISFEAQGLPPVFETGVDEVVQTGEQGLVGASIPLALFYQPRYRE